MLFSTFCFSVWKEIVCYSDFSEFNHLSSALTLFGYVVKLLYLFWFLIIYFVSLSCLIMHDYACHNWTIMLGWKSLVETEESGRFSLLINRMTKYLLEEVGNECRVTYNLLFHYHFKSSQIWPFAIYRQIIIIHFVYI